MTRRPPRTRRMRLFELLLRLYPVRFRARYAREMTQTLRQELEDARAAGGLRSAMLWVTVLGGVAIAGTAARAGDVARGLAHDTRHAVRHAARHKLATTTTVLTLALSLGVVAAVFSLVREVLIEPLPYRDASRLAALWTVDRIGEAAQPVVSTPDFLEIAQRTRVFEDLAGAVGFTASLAGAEADAEEVRTAMVTWNFFPLLGVDPMLGRHFRPDEQGTEIRRALITHDLWQGRYAGDPRIVGRTIRMNGSEIEVVGVLPEGWVFYAPDGSGASIASTHDLRVWEVFRFDLETFPRDGRFFTTIARLRDGADWPEVRGEMATHTDALRREVPEYEERGTSVVATPLKEGVIGASDSPLWALSLASAVVLFIAMVDLVALGQARLVTREREFEVRVALGAERSQLIRQRVVESATVAAVGALGGATLAQLLIELVRVVGPDAVPRLDTVGIDRAVLAFALGVGMLLALLVALLPAYRSGLHTAAGLGTRGTAGRGRAVRGGVIAAQVAVSLALLVGTGLLGRTLHGLMTVDRGFDATGATVTFFPSMGFFRYTGQADAMIAFHDQLERRLRAEPGVTALGTTSQLPLTGPAGVRIVSYDDASAADWGSVRLESLVVSDGFFEAVGTPLVRGRGFEPSDDRSAPLVAVVDQRFAGHAWAGQDPVGRVLTVEIGDNGVVKQGPHPVRVVGVASDVAVKAPSLGPGAGRIYLPFDQQPGMTAYYVVRTSTPPARILDAAQEVIDAFDSDIALTRVSSLGSMLAEATGRERFTLVLLLTFAGVAFVLVLVGVYGIVSSAVARRVPEYGVRLALGARPERVATAVLAEGLRPTLYGLIAGVVLAAAAGRLIESLLYGVTVRDPATYLVACIGLLTAILAACLGPALRILRIDPVRVLQSE